MKRKIKKIFTIILVLLLLLQINSFATLTPREINGNVYIPNEGEITNVAKNVLGIIDFGGTILSIVIIIVLGIQYLKASLEQKAQYKEKMIPYVIGCIFLFAAPKVANFVYKIATRI